MKKIALIALASLFSLAAQAGDIEAGKAKSMLCAACHGADGISLAPIYPNLKGQKAQYIEKQLKAFKEGTRQDPVMAPMAMPLTDEDIANLAAYFESLK
ncbi:cytochrome c [Shewanella insulae]|uniref:c-type cytochrome n=1 Tax=Shewanella insulae TaxID=2681496 RepID=UPI001EFDB41B|nr:cytochrome c [Shewanella insulae]MCG9712368.1 cytochrome c [Shewanella insulae]